jgi:hypothetical protein
MTMLTRVAAILGVLSLPVATATAATYAEASNGDLSGNRAAPTQFALASGSNTLTATTQGGDLDVVRIDVPAGNTLSQLFVRSFTQAGFDSTAFLGLQSGPTFTVDPNIAGASELLGYAHISPAFVNFDILPGMGNAFDAIGYTPPLAAGPYSIFLQQLGTPVTYSLEFVVRPVPEPATIVLGGVGLAFLFVAARRKSR